MDTGSIIALIFGSITVLAGLLGGGMYVGRLVAALEETNKTNAEMSKTIAELGKIIADHDDKLREFRDRLTHLEGARR